MFLTFYSRHFLYLIGYRNDENNFLFAKRDKSIIFINIHVYLPKKSSDTTKSHVKIVRPTFVRS